MNQHNNKKSHDILISNNHTYQHHCVMYCREGESPPLWNPSLSVMSPGANKWEEFPLCDTLCNVTSNLQVRGNPLSVMSPGTDMLGGIPFLWCHQELTSEGEFPLWCHQELTRGGIPSLWCHQELTSEGEFPVCDVTRNSQVRGILSVLPRESWCPPVAWSPWPYTSPSPTPPHTPPSSSCER